MRKKMCADSNEEVFREYVKRCPIEIPEDELAKEIELQIISIKHEMQYEMLASGCMVKYSAEELEEKMTEIREEAELSIKSEMVIKDILTKYPIDVSREELEAEAAAIADRQSISPEMMEKFFGDNWDFLAQDLRVKKIIRYICNQSL